MKHPSKVFESKREFIDYISKSDRIPVKEDLICSLCSGKNVLDIGCVNHSYETAIRLGDNWLHKRLKEVSKSLVGIDILEEDAKKLNELNFNIIVANAESFDLGRTFDVINCGDIIEHLSNIGLFLQNVKKHMHDDSICIITTPNPFNIEQTMLAILENRISVNDEHTVWLDPRVMYTTMSRSGLRIVDFYWIQTRFKVSLRRKYYGFLARKLSEFIMKRRVICRRDYCVILKRLV